MKPYRLCILGSNSGNNAGDAAILSSIVHNFLARSPNVAFEVPTTKPSYIRRSFPGLPVRPVSIMPWTGSLRILGPSTMLSILRSDAVLITDAIMFDYALFNPLYNYLILLAGLIPFAKLCRRRILCFCVGIGPLKTRAGRRIARMVCDFADEIMVREEHSRNLLVEIGVPRARLAQLWADTAFINPPAPLERGAAILREVGIEPGEPLLGVNVNPYLDTWVADRPSLRREEFTAGFARALDAAIERCGCRVVFVPTHPMDIVTSEAIRSRMTRRERSVVLSSREITNQEIMAVMGCTSLFAGMRLHSVILASAMHVPIVPLVYAPKVRHLAEMLGIGDTSFEFADFSAERLTDALVRGWETREATRARMIPGVEAAKARARGAFDQVAARFIARGAGAAAR